LLLQVLGAMAGNGNHASGFLYITGEEAPSQIAARAMRLRAAAAPRAATARERPTANFESEQLKLASETDLSNILEMLESEHPSVAVVDSVQTLRDAGIPSAPGSVSQVRE